MSWREQVTPERPTVSLGDMTDGDTLAGQFLDDGRLKETRHGEALVVGFRASDFPEGYSTMNDVGLEEGEEYNLMTSSSRLQSRLADFASDLEGASFTITAIEGDTAFDRTYKVE